MRQAKCAVTQVYLHAAALQGVLQASIETGFEAHAGSGMVLSLLM